MLDNDNQLVEQAQNSPAAFAALYDRYVDRIFAYAQRLMQDEAAAQDVTAVTFEKALRHIQRYQWQGSSFANWLYRIARNEAMSKLRRQKWLSPKQWFGQTELRVTETAYFFHEQTLTGSRWLLAEEEVVVETAVATREALVVGTDSNGLTLRNSPGGQEIAILPEGSQVMLVDGMQPVELEGVLWQQVKMDDQIGWVAQEFLSISAKATISPQQAAHDVWLLSATQQARASTDAPITLEITVGYQFNLDAEVTLKPLYAAPNWESTGLPRLPLDGLGDAVVLDGRKGTISFTFNGNPDEMRQIVGTDQPVVVMQLGYFVEDERFEILAMPTLPQFNIDLNSIEEITFNTQ